MKNENLERKAENRKLMKLGGVTLALASAVVGLHLYTKPVQEAPNWARGLAQIASVDGEVRHYIQRNGAHLYVAKTDYGTKYVLDSDNNGVPDQEVALIDRVVQSDSRETRLHGGWVSRYSNDPTVDKFGMPNLQPTSTRMLPEWEQE